MGKVNAGKSMASIYTIANDKNECNISIKSKLNLWSLIFGIVEIAIIWVFIFPVINRTIDDYIIVNVLIMILCIVLSLLLIMSIFWMIWGIEEMYLKGTVISVSQKLFGFGIIVRNFAINSLQNGRVNMTLPDDLKESRWVLLRILKLSYNYYSFQAAYCFEGGKIVFDFKNRLVRFANNVDEATAHKILMHIGDFTEKIQKMTKTQAVSNPAQTTDKGIFNRKSYNLINILLLMSLLLFVLILFFVIIEPGE